MYTLYQDLLMEGNVHEDGFGGFIFIAGTTIGTIDYCDEEQSGCWKVTSFGDRRVVKSTICAEEKIRKKKKATSPFQVTGGK